MKRTIRRYKISNRLNATAPSPPSAIDASEPGPFADSMNVVDQRLRASRTPAPDPPPWLHASIMNEVQREAADGPGRSRPYGFLPAWTWGAVSAALLVTVWALMNPMRPGGDVVSSAGHTEADKMVRMAAVQGAVVLMEPFEAELENLSRDLDRTTEFLLASLP